MIQVTPLPAPALPTPAPQDAAKTVPQQIQAQAAMPLVQRAVDPSPAAQKKPQTRSNGDKAKGGQGGQAGDDKRGGSVNLRV